MIFKTHIEKDLLTVFNQHPGHQTCSLILKCSYKEPYRYALYCIEHDRYFRWINHDDIGLYKEYGINHVTYSDNEIYLDIEYFKHPWAFENEMTKGHGSFKKKTIEVINKRTKQPQSLWIAFNKQPLRDPSLSEYWKFIDSFK